MAVRKDVRMKQLRDMLHEYTSVTKMQYCDNISINYT